MRVLPCGPSALLVEVDDLDAGRALDAAHGLAAAVRALPGLEDVVVGARTVLLRAADGVDLAALGHAVRALGLAAADLDGGGPDVSGPVVTIPVHYDGPDLGDVARACGRSPAEVVAAHTAAPWRVAFVGFAPGFAYLTGGPGPEVARRTEPRPRVPAGSVGLAGPFSGVYPRESPGGWQLVGRTDAVLFDARRDPPALLQPGCTVRFVDAG